MVVKPLTLAYSSVLVISWRPYPAPRRSRLMTTDSIHAASGSLGRVLSLEWPITSVSPCEVVFRRSRDVGNWSQEVLSDLILKYKGAHCVN
ncbi:hypothetical protein E2C01_016842 [Portunus trituberculatus]|uniref:Uncharacterized protein n=1 Tax=Portunus trituberculatus TaxID=210409 RepID=A0A5B7DQV0_PORTR|nr:hypothetical protein [Portunus trituberculatus]